MTGLKNTDFTSKVLIMQEINASAGHNHPQPLLFFLHSSGIIVMFKCSYQFSGNNMECMVLPKHTQTNTQTNKLYLSHIISRTHVN